MPRGRPSRLVVFDRLDQAVDELIGVGGLPHPAEAEDIWDGIWFEETHHSTAIEGNTLILKEVKALLEEGRAVGEKELREYLEVQGYADAARWVYQRAHHTAVAGPEDLIVLSELREVHDLVVRPVWLHFPPPSQDQAEGPGSFRRHDIELFAGGMKPPPWPDVPALVTDWVAAANDVKDYATRWLEAGTPLSTVTDHPVARLADLHAGFERIHPFRDGNGRTGRLVMNLMLVRLGYPPAVVYKRDRAKYLRGLDRADKRDAGPLAELVARSVIHGINRFLLPALAGPQRLVPLVALADQELSLIALRRAADRGRLRALRRRDQWYSTRKWVNEYRSSRQRGRPGARRERAERIEPVQEQLEL